jgi:starvation-inducible DNA-binding protein
LRRGRALSQDEEKFHKHISAPHFRDYHFLLDEQATESVAMTDAVADVVLSEIVRDF